MASSKGTNDQGESLKQQGGPMIQERVAW
eukprot:SAG31_NODE_22132_length_529_cov_0.755760_1_plen_28_part_10